MFFAQFHIRRLKTKLSEVLCHLNVCRDLFRHEKWKHSWLHLSPEDIPLAFCTFVM